VFTVENVVDQMDPSVVAGAFTWDTTAPEHHDHEIDFEFGQWKDPQNQKAEWVMQPSDAPEDRYRFDGDGDGFADFPEAPAAARRRHAPKRSSARTESTTILHRTT
jgi:hypothetical protein